MRFKKITTLSKKNLVKDESVLVNLFIMQKFLSFVQKIKL